jgi:hypothetical protein
LRHLNSVYKVLSQTVPDLVKNDAVREMELYLISMIRQVDSSLLDEWEKMRDPNYQRAEAKEVRPPGADEAARDITRDTKAFTATIRNRIFSFLRVVANGEYETALALLQRKSTDESSNVDNPGAAPAQAVDAEEHAWRAGRLKEVMARYQSEHSYFSLDPNARNLRHTYILVAEDKRTWRVQQMLIDPDEHNDWVAEFEVDLVQSRELEEPVVRLLRIGPLTEG